MTEGAPWKFISAVRPTRDEAIRVAGEQADEIERLQDALRDILDHHEGWTRPMAPDERWDAVARIASAALSPGVR